VIAKDERVPDESLINRAAPPGSLRYFSLLYAPAGQRSPLSALLVIEMEIRESACSVNHDVAHTRLRWWRSEVDRLVNGAAQHPATRVLQSDAAMPRADWNLLHEVLSAADMDLARLTYHSLDELSAYAARSSGAIHELATLQALAPAAVSPTLRSAVNRLGGCLRQTEILREVRQDCRAGRLYLPLDMLERHGIGLSELQQPQFSAQTQAALREYGAGVRERFDMALAALEPGGCDGEPRGSTHAALRPLLVLAALHRRLLQRMLARLPALAGERIELGPIEKPWIAWRAAMRAG
jgi:15-cis-phytoene synthase